MKAIHAEIKNNSAVLVDIREEDELKESGIAQGALWMPTSKMAENHDDWVAFKEKLPKDKTIYMYCRGGGRVTRVAGMLCCQGYKVENIGGLKDWVEAGLPVEPYKG